MITKTNNDNDQEAGGALLLTETLDERRNYLKFGGDPLVLIEFKDRCVHHSEVWTWRKPSLLDLIANGPNYTMVLAEFVGVTVIAQPVWDKVMDYSLWLVIHTQPEHPEFLLGLSDWDVWDMASLLCGYNTQLAIPGENFNEWLNRVRE